LISVSASKWCSTDLHLPR